MAPKRTIPVRMTDEMLRQLDEVAALLSERAAGAEVSRSEATRVALERGLEALTKELGRRRGR